ncbi:MAG: hypothetical protein M9921_15760 [Fimbriimonadaceae bacterium]|nr:hypothetical protein [Fimbriimonadaceae bacterium]
MTADTFIRVQGVIIVIVTAAFEFFVMRHFAFWRVRILWLVAGVVAIVAVNTFITMRWGSYRRRIT